MPDPGAHKDPHADPHAELHELAAQEPVQHEPVADEPGESLEEKVDRLNAEQTRRINDLRTDFATTKTAISNSVRAISDEIEQLKAAVQNNKDAIEAQDAVIQDARRRADAAVRAAQVLEPRITSVEQGAQKLSQNLEQLGTAYAHHIHAAAIQVHTGPPGSPEDGGGPGDSGHHENQRTS